MIDYEGYVGGEYIGMGGDSTYIELNDGKLADVAPTMLKLLGLEIPSEMTGNCLIK